MTTAVYVQSAAAFPLPWSIGSEDRARFKRWLLICLLAVVTAGVVIPFIPLPQVSRQELESLPPRLAQIVMERPKPVIPPAPPPPPKVEEKPAQEKAKPEPKPKPAQPKPDKDTAVADAREKAATSGLLQFKDMFADMRESVDVGKLQDTGAIQRGSGQAATIDRSVLTSKHATRSSGVNVAALSRETGGVALAGRETTKVKVPEGAKGDGGTRAQQQTDPRSRSIEDIRRIFDANKGAIFAIYNRALRSDPTLSGKLVLELVIAPSGRVTDIRVVASELKDEELVGKILARVRLFDFGKRDVGVTTIDYPVDFLPT